ncbi:MAG: hypothetical protein QXT66_03445 [Nitrososphaerota archaeon]
MLVMAAFIAMMSPDLVYYIASFAVFWLVFGGWLAIAPNAASTFLGMKNLGANYGIVFTAYGVSALVGPPLAAYLQNMTQMHSTPFAMIAVLVVVGLAISSLSLRTKRPLKHLELCGLASVIA